MIWRFLLIISLVLLTIMVLKFKKINLNRTLTISFIRMSVQLILVGLMLRYIFSEQENSITIFILFTMTLSGGYIAYERQVSKYQGMLAHGCG